MRRIPLVLLLLLGSCAAPRSGADEVVDSGLRPAPVATVPGPAYLLQRQDRRGFSWRVVVGGKERDLGRSSDVAWLPDGRVLRTGIEAGRRPGMRVVDPRTGGPVGPLRRVDVAQLGVTPEAITIGGYLRRTRLVVWSPDLAERRVIDVPASSVRTDQIGDDAEFSLHHSPYTLGGVTWTQWGINSENDTLTDHGVLRIEGGEVTEVLRDQPVVDLRPSRDGAALLVIMQDNGEDEDCGGCTVEQKIVELDPATGAIAGDYGMPPGYTRAWRIETLDKMGDRVVVRFWLGGGTHRRRTWVYDGSWAELAQARDRRVRWQGGGSLVWSQEDRTRDAGEGAAFRLAWEPAAGGSDILIGPDARCPEPWDGVRVCPQVFAPGSLLPPSSSS